MGTITGMADTTTAIRMGIHTIMDIHTTTRTITDIHMDTHTIIHTTTRMDTITHTRTGTHTDTIIMLPPRLRIPTTMADILTTTTTICTAFSYTLPQTPVARWPSFSQLP
jgi:hypothetical protein